MKGPRTQTNMFFKELAENFFYKMLSILSGRKTDSTALYAGAMESSRFEGKISQSSFYVYIVTSLSALQVPSSSLSVYTLLHIQPFSAHEFETLLFPFS